MKIEKFIPRFIRKFIFKKYALKMYDDAVAKANALHELDGHRYFVLPTMSGDLKVTNGDEETRDRVRDKRVLKRSIRKPYQLRRESFYFTASDVCKRKYQRTAMLDWEIKEHKKMFLRWYFTKH